MALDEWRAIAQQLSDQVKNNYINSNKGVLDSINAQKEAELNNLANSNTQAINNLNSNKETINSTALDNAKQANINRLLALKDNKSAMSRAGLNSQGLVGSQVNSINNNYGTNLNTILKDKASGLRDIQNQINNTNLQYETNKSNLAAQYAQTLANQRSNIESTALQLGQDAYNNYIAQKQAEAQLEEQKRQANLENQLAWAQLRASNNSNYSFGDSNDNNYEVNTAYYQGNLNPDAQYGTFSNGYQPNNIAGQKLKSSGRKMKITTTDRFGKTQTLTQTVWKTADGRKWYWDGRYNKYFQYK